LSYGSSANLLHQSRYRGVSPTIWRRLRLQGNTSLAGLHHIIQIAMGWDDEYLHYFHI
jgi:transposase InsO family protein